MGRHQGFHAPAHVVPTLPFRHPKLPRRALAAFRIVPADQTPLFTSGGVVQQLALGLGSYSRSRTNQHCPPALHLLFSPAYHSAIHDCPLHSPNFGQCGLMPRTSPTLIFTTYTPRQLARFDGKDGGWILPAISGTLLNFTARGVFRRGTQPDPETKSGGSVGITDYGTAF